MLTGELFRLLNAPQPGIPPQPLVFRSHLVVVNSSCIECPCPLIAASWSANVDAARPKNSDYFRSCCECAGIGRVVGVEVHRASAICSRPFHYNSPLRSVGSRL